MRSCRSQPLPVAIPGPAGSPVYAVVTLSFTVPDVGLTVGVQVSDISMFIIGQNVYVGSWQTSGANFVVEKISGGNLLTLKCLGFVNDATPGTILPANSLVVSGSGNISPFLEFGVTADFAVVTQSFVVPNGETDVMVSASNVTPLVAGQNVFIPGGFNFIVQSVNSPTSVTLLFLSLTGDSQPGSTIAAGTLILPGFGNQSNIYNYTSVTNVNGTPTFSTGIASTSGNGTSPSLKFNFIGDVGFNVTVSATTKNLQFTISYAGPCTVFILKNGVSIFSQSSLSGNANFTVTLKPGDLLNLSGAINPAGATVVYSKEI